MNINELQPPHNLEAEQAVLGAILIDQDVLYEVGERVSAEMFYQPRHKWLYEAVQSLHSKQRPVDLIAVSEELTRAGKLELVGDMPYLIDLLNAVPTSVNAAYYAEIVAEGATRRRLLAATSKIAKAAYNVETPVDEVMTLAETEILTANSGALKSAVKAPQRYMSDYLDAFMRDVASTESPRVIKTGLLDLDRLLGGLERGHQYFIAGATSMGKSSLALGIALDAAINQGKRVLVFSLEMSEEQLNNRFVSLLTGIKVESLKAARRRYLTTEEQTRVMEATGRINDSKLFLDCSAGIRPADVHSRASRVYAEHGLDLIMVDHMHIMQANAPTGKQVQDLGAISMDLANIYKSLNVTGITLAQINREVAKRAIKMPMLADLRESGQIEENAYVVMFVHRPAYYDPETEDANLAKIIVAKNRDGATGQVDAFWNATIAAFRNVRLEEVIL